MESVSEIQAGDLILKIKAPSGKIKDLKVNMLVLSTNLTPHRDNSELANHLGIELDDHVFFKDRDHVYEPLVTRREGTFIAGTAQGPKDISESIAQAITKLKPIAKVHILHRD